MNIINKEKSTSYKLTEGKSHGLVKYGHDNLFPQYLVKLLNNSAVHGACISAKHDAMVGDGLVADIDGVLAFANPMESWNEIYTKVAYDYSVFGFFALEVIWSKDREKVSLYHIDASMVRAGEKDEMGRIPHYYLSAEWKKTYNPNSNTPCIPTFDPREKQDQPKQIFVYQPYRPNMEYYSLPTYMGGLNAIELDAEVDNFHKNNIKNGMAPSVAITTFTNATNEERQLIERALKDQYAGSDNAGSILYMDVASQELAPQITPIQPNGTDTYYKDLAENIEQKIITAHKITSPMILGIKTEGQLGGRDEVVDAYLLFQNNVIRPLQQGILGVFEKFLAINHGGEVKLGVEVKQLFDDNSIEKEVVVSTENTEADSQELEDKTEE